MQIKTHKSMKLNKNSDKIISQATINIVANCTHCGTDNDITYDLLSSQNVFRIFTDGENHCISPFVIKCDKCNSELLINKLLV